MAGPSADGTVEVGTALEVLRRVNLLAESNALAIDIGGSLAKLLYLQPYGTAKMSPPLIIDQVGGSPTRGLSVHVPSLKGTLHFFAFETRNVDQLVTFMKDYWEVEEHRYVRSTGGGAYKYADLFEKSIGVTLNRLDEMACVVAGLNFLVTSVDREVFTFRPPPMPANSRKDSSRSEKPPSSMDNARNFIPSCSDPFPYLLVNIGSGVSIVKVTGHGEFDRVSGSSLGGGTFWGLARLLLNVRTFDEVIALTNDADNANVDMLVADIYGGAYESLGLNADVIAASFGKVTMRKDQQPNSRREEIAKRFSRAAYGTFSLWVAFLLALPLIGGLLRFFGVRQHHASLANLTLKHHFRPQDVALSLLRMVSYNIGQIAYLNARVHNLERIYFGGNFIRDHPYTIADISFAVNFWSNGATQALFMRHDGYLGAIGAFLGADSTSSERIETAVPRNGGLNGTTPVGYDEESHSNGSTGRVGPAQAPPVTNGNKGDPTSTSLSAHVCHPDKTPTDKVQATPSPAHALTESDGLSSSTGFASTNDGVEQRTLTRARRRAGVAPTDPSSATE